MNRLTRVGRQSLLRASAVLGLLALTACGQQEPAAKTDQPGQVIAKVGSEDVTIHELQHEYRRAGVTQDKVTDAITKAVLEEVTRRKLLAQKARAAGLDREPTVLLDIQRSREQVLASALFQRDIQARVSGIGKSELDRYVNANPERFARRIRYDIDQMTFNAATIRQDFLDAIKDATSLDVVESKALESRIAYTRGVGALYSGEIPTELLSRLKARKESDVFFVRAGTTSSFFKVRAEVPDPLAGEEAQQRAQVLIRNETAQSEMQRKTDEVQITYFGEYTKIMEKPAAAPAAGGAEAGGGTLPTGTAAPKP